MSRSRLLRLLRQAYQIDQFSQKTGIPTDEVMGICGEKRLWQSRISRRRLLHGALAVAGTTAALSWRRNEQRVAAQSNISPVLVVGAGMAGLTAAYRLQQAGVPVDLVEARNTVGGRMRSVHRAVGTPHTLDLGAEYVNSDHTCLRSLVEELELNLVDLYPFYQAPGKELEQIIYFYQGNKIALADLVEGFAPLMGRIAQDIEAISNFESYEKFDPPTAALDRLSISEYLESLETPPAVQEMINVAMVAENGLEPEEQSAVNFLYTVGTQSGQFAPLAESDERYHIDGGSAQVTSKLGKLMANSLEVGTVLEAITSLPDGRYRVSFLAQQSSFERTYERVLLTIPFSVLRTVELNVELPPVKKLAILTLGYGTNTKLTTGYKQKIWRDRYSAVGDVYLDTNYQIMYENAQSVHGPGEFGLFTEYSGGKHGLAIGQETAHFQAARKLKLLEQVFPGIEPTRLPIRTIRAHWAGEFFSRGSYTCYKPGQFTKLYGAAGERVGNIWFAGEHTSWEYYGYMEGACESGEIAAAEILEDLGFKASAAQQKARVNHNFLARGKSSRRLKLLREFEY